MLRISDFIKKIMNLNYDFSSRHVRKKLTFLVHLSILPNNKRTIDISHGHIEGMGGLDSLLTLSSPLNLLLLKHIYCLALVDDSLKNT